MIVEDQFRHRCLLSLRHIKYCGKEIQMGQVSREMPFAALPFAYGNEIPAGLGISLLVCNGFHLIFQEDNFSDPHFRSLHFFPGQFPERIHCDHEIFMHGSLYPLHFPAPLFFSLIRPESPDQTRFKGCPIGRGRWPQIFIAKHYHDDPRGGNKNPGHRTPANNDSTSFLSSGELRHYIYVSSAAEDERYCTG
ncbi:hypothetical protein [Desulfococcus sp.]|uniref:hypothetical protein n=1 Tax=Desulfococcus sp. TaxID=2025834 RepID=UPI003D0E8B52